MTIIGLADVADSLSAIQQVVFGHGSATTFAELLRALRDDFKGQGDLKKRLERAPKYGNEHPMADANVAWIVKLLDEAIGAKTNFCRAHYRVGYWTMTNHAGFGMLMGAMPSGRPAGANFASGITPASGKADSLSHALNSVAALPPKRLSSGVALNLKYTPGDGQEMLDNFAASVAGYFDGPGNEKDSGKGGMEIQFNVTNRTTFEDAVESPGDHPKLLVRVSGYTAYFIDLNPRMQQEIINRTEYRLSTGEAEQYPWYSLDD